MKEERLKVLQLLNDSKITAEEAAKLLAALSIPELEPAPRTPKPPREARRYDNSNLPVDEEGLRQLGRTLGKTGQQMGRKIGQEVNKVMSDEDLRIAGKKIGSRMKDLGAVIRSEVRQAMEELKQDIAEQKKNNGSMSELGKNLEDTLENTVKSIWHGTRTAEEEVQADLEEKREELDEAMDELREAMEEVSEASLDLDNDWEEWTSESGIKAPEDTEEFIQQMRNGMAELASKMAQVTEQCLALQQVERGEQETRYINELVAWAKQGNSVADQKLSQLELNLSEIQAILLSKPDDLSIDF